MNVGNFTVPLYRQPPLTQCVQQLRNGKVCHLVIGSLLFTGLTRIILACRLPPPVLLSLFRFLLISSSFWLVNSSGSVLLPLPRIQLSFGSHGPHGISLRLPPETQFPGLLLTRWAARRHEPRRLRAGSRVQLQTNTPFFLHMGKFRTRATWSVYDSVEPNTTLFPRSPTPDVETCASKNFMLRSLPPETPRCVSLHTAGASAPRQFHQLRPQPPAGIPGLARVFPGAATCRLSTSKNRFPSRPALGGSVASFRLLHVLVFPTSVNFGINSATHSPRPSRPASILLHSSISIRPSTLSASIQSVRRPCLHPISASVISLCT